MDDNLIKKLAQIRNANSFFLALRSLNENITEFESALVFAEIHKGGDLELEELSNVGDGIIYKNK